MVAVRCRPVGNRGQLVDPGAVLAVYRTTAGVALLLEGGHELLVWSPPRDERAHRRRAVTEADVANVHRALTVRPS